jgi:hypothetical protein
MEYVDLKILGDRTMELADEGEIFQRETALTFFFFYEDWLLFPDCDWF